MQQSRIRRGRPPSAALRVRRWIEENPESVERLRAGAIAKATRCHRSTVTRVLGPRDDLARLCRDGLTRRAGTLTPEPDPVPTSKVIDDVELWLLLKRWRALRSLGRLRESDALFARRIYDPLRGLVKSTARTMPTRGMITEEHRAACVVHIVELLLTKWSAAKARPRRCGSFVTFNAWRYLIDCNTGNKAARQTSVAATVIHRHHSHDMLRSATLDEDADRLRLAKAADKVVSIKPHKSDPARVVVRLRTYHRPCSPMLDSDEARVGVDPRSLGYGWDPWDNRVTTRRVVRGYVAEVLAAVGDVDLTTHARANEATIRRAWRAWRRDNAMPPRVDDDTWAEVRDAMRQLAELD